MKAVVLQSFLLISNCQYLLLASNMDSTVDTPKESMYSSIGGMKYESRSVKELSHLQSTQNLIVSFFFGAKTMDTAHLVCGGSMTFLFEYFIDFVFFEVRRFRAQTIQRRVDGLHIIIETFDTMFCGVNVAKVAVPDCSKLGQHIYGFVTVL